MFITARTNPCLATFRSYICSFSRNLTHLLSLWLCAIIQCNNKSLRCNVKQESLLCIELPDLTPTCCIISMNYMSTTCVAGIKTEITNVVYAGPKKSHHSCNSHYNNILTYIVLSRRSNAILMEHVLRQY